MKKEKGEEESIGLKMADKTVDKENDYNVVVVDGSAGDANLVENGDNFQMVKSESYTGLKKEDLLRYAKDPYWVRLRIILLVVFGLIWLAMLVAAIIIIVLTPKCPPRPEQEWWESAVVYCIQPKSFFDSDRDGVGDLEGIHSKLDYIKENIKADAVNLGVVQQSSGKTLLGTDVSDFMVVHTGLGTQEQFDNLRAALHKKGIKMVLDFVPNHSSDEHPWFLASKEKTKPYDGFYIWHPGSDSDGPPNNLKNSEGGSAWTYDDTRREFYYHSGLSHEPDLNLTNPAVVAKLDEAIQHWLKLKVDGIRILGGSHLVEDESIFSVGVEANETVSWPETIGLVNHWRQLVDNYTSSEKRKSQPQVRALFLDVDNMPMNVSTFFGSKGSEDLRFGPHLIVNKQLLKLDEHCGARCLSGLIHAWFGSIGKTSRRSNWMLSDAGVRRVASRLDDRNLLNAINLLLLTLPGSAFVHYGDEIGMKDTKFNRTADGTNQSFVSYGPMQWMDQDQAGFSKHEPWIPVSDEYHTFNVESQLAQGSGMSTLRVFSKLTSLKKEPSVRWGKFRATFSRNVYLYVRKAEGHPSVLVAVNLGPMSTTVSLRNTNLSDDLSQVKEATVLASTYNFAQIMGTKAPGFADNAQVDLDTAILLNPGEGVVLKWQEEKSLF